MKQSVQVMVHLYFDGMSSESIDNQPSREMIKKEIQKIVSGESPLSYTEIRGASHNENTDTT